MRKWILILLTVLLLSGCAAPESTAPTETLPDPAAIEARIRADWLKAGNQEMGAWYDFNDETTKDCQWRYYGCFDGFEILFCADMTAANEQKLIAGQCFSHPCGFTLYAYCDGTFVTLEEAYQKNLIDAHAVWDIARCHFECQCEIYGDEYVEELYIGYEKPE